MDRISRILIGLVATCFVLILISRIIGAFVSPISRGILYVPGYEHASLVCGDGATDEPMVTHVEPKKHVLTHRYGSTIVSWGHLEDPQVGELERIAEFACGYKKMERPWIQRFIGVAGHNHFISIIGDDVVLRSVQSGDRFEVGRGQEQLPNFYEGEQGILLGEEAGRHMESCDHDFNTILVK